MYDIFYSGSKKPNLFPHERPAATLADARKLSRTTHFWFVDGSNDLREFDFNWVPQWSEWHQTHIHLLYSQFEQFQVVLAPTQVNEEVEHYYDKRYLPRKAIAEYFKVLKTEAKWKIDPNWAPNPNSQETSK